MAEITKIRAYSPHKNKENKPPLLGERSAGGRGDGQKLSKIKENYH